MKKNGEKFLRAGWPAISLIGILVVVAVVGANLNPVNQRHTIEILINVVLVVGLYVFAGNSGVLSFGQMSFMSIGAYTTALFTIPVIQKAFLLPSLPGFIGSAELAPIPAALLAGAMAVVFGLIIVFPISRLSGLAAALAMFAVLVIVYQVGINWEAVTRGTRTMLGVPINTTIWSALAWTIICVLIAFAYQRSSSGLRLRATREDEFAAKAAAISIPRERAIAFLISAFVVGIGGYLYAQFQGAFTPAAFYTHVTFLTIAMLVVGGQRSLAGAVVGAVTVSILSFLFNSIENGVSAGPIHFAGRDGLSDTALAAFILLALLFRRDGIMRGREFELRRPGWMRRSGGGAVGGKPAVANTDPQAKEA
ncbi:MAG: branched-chain amino acid ABC transporter permease [Actinobacteria bacterium]|nr:branched-chain amino acid ABC transporter permease [Actinomycetota bacterium]